MSIPVKMERGSHIEMLRCESTSRAHAVAGTHKRHAAKVKGRCGGPSSRDLSMQSDRVWAE